MSEKEAIACGGRLILQTLEKTDNMMGFKKFHGQATELKGVKDIEGTVKLAIEFTFNAV
jgi:hypothetical protein